MQIPDPLVSKNYKIILVIVDRFSKGCFVPFCFRELGLLFFSLFWTETESCIARSRDMRPGFRFFVDGLLFVFVLLFF